jgi:hypothetical protein
LGCLHRIHWDVAHENQGAPLPVIQTKTLELIRSVVDDGLVRLGDLTGMTVVSCLGIAQLTNRLIGSETFTPPGSPIKTYCRGGIEAYRDIVQVGGEEPCIVVQRRRSRFRAK